MNRIYLSLLIIIFFSCNQRQEKKIPEIAINLNQAAIPDTCWFDQHEAIFLDTPEDCLLSDISKINLFEDRLILLDQANKIVACFKRNGTYLFKIDQQGRGPGEFINISDYGLNREKKEIIIYDSQRSVFLFYSLDDGKFLREIPTDKLLNEMVLISDQIVGLNYYVDAPSHYLSLLKFNDKSITKVKDLPMQQWEVNSSFAKGNQISNSENLNFTRRYDNTIYSLINNKIHPRFRLQFGDKNLPNGIYKSKMDDIDFFDKISDKYVFSIVNVKETPGTVYFSTHFHGFCAFSKTTLEGGNYFPMAIRNWGEIYMGNMVTVEEETNRYIGFVKSVSTMKNYANLKGVHKEFKNYPFDRTEIEKFQERIHALDDNANPIILLFHSKL